jgi:hypothetical protein
MGGLRPIADVGVVGGGQLARMTVQAAVSLGVSTRVLAGNEGAPTTGCSASPARPPSTSGSRCRRGRERHPARGGRDGQRQGPAGLAHQPVAVTDLVAEYL